MSIRLGRHSYIHENIVDNFFGVEVEVGNFTSIARGLKVYGNTGQHPPANHPYCVSTFPFKEFGFPYPLPCEGKGSVKIGSDVWIGGNVTLLDGITIGHGAIIGASTVIAKDVPDYAVVVGNPGHIAKYRFDFQQRVKLLELAWWNWTDEKITKNLHLFTHIVTFLANAESL